MLSAALLALALGFTCDVSATTPCDIGLVETSLLLRAIDFLKTNSTSGCHGPALAQPQTIKVSITDTQGSVYISYPAGIQAIIYKGGVDTPVLETLGDVPPTCQVPAAAWKFVEDALLWIHADVSFNATAQRSILVQNAHCFGAEGRDAIVEGNIELSKSVAFAVPHTIQLDPLNAMVIWDFDVIDRETCLVSGRGTDFVHFCPGGHVYQVDTIRHTGAQPEWARQQIQSPANATSACRL
jgi:hypothetical protein